MATTKKKKGDEAPAPAATPAPVPQQPTPQQFVPQPQMQPGYAVPMMPMQPGVGVPMMPMQPGMAPQQNPMFAMMQMMQQMMMGGMGGGFGMPQMDPSAIPFAAGASAKPDGDKGLDADIIRPATLSDRMRSQEAVSIGSVLDLLCLTEDGEHALGGIPKGCTIAFAGPPGKGKTRTALAALAKVAARGEKVAFIVAEEGFHDENGSGRDDLCSRLVKIGMQVTGLDEDDFTDQVLENMYVLECQYHKGTTWDDFVGKYRYLVEKEKIKFVVIDSLNMLDPTRNRTADNLSALKTYNHEEGITCLCLGQIRDTGMPVGGEALQHTADCVFLIEEMSLGSKEIADLWGGKYRDKIDVINCVKSVTTPRFEYPVRLGRDAATGILTVHEAQPADFAVLAPAEKE